MGKLTDPKWWLGQSDDQKARRAAASAGMRQVREDWKRGNAETREQFAAARERGQERRTEAREAKAAEKAARKAQRHQS